ncbi:MAG: Ig domain-containing protein, partial [Myxococcales bacterium]
VAIESPTTLVFVGTTLPMRATVLDANDAPLANVPVSWSTSDPSVATVDPNGVVTAKGQGLATITASGGGASGKTPIHVTTSSLDVQPSASEALAGNTVQLSAGQAAGPVTWETSNPLMATVSPTGLVTARYPGSVQIFATTSSPSGAQRGTATILITAATLDISPSNAGISSGDTVRFTATARDTKGAILDVPIAWASSDPQLAPINASGLVVGYAPTAATIRAVGGGLVRGASLTVADIAGFGVPARPPTSHEPTHTPAYHKPGPD